MKKFLSLMLAAGLVTLSGCNWNSWCGSNCSSSENVDAAAESEATTEETSNKEVAAPAEDAAAESEATTENNSDVA